MSLEQSILSQLLGFSNRVASAESAAKSLQQSNNQFLKGLTDINDKLTAQGVRLTDSIDALSEIVLLISNTNPEKLSISDLEARLEVVENQPVTLQAFDFVQATKPALSTGKSWFNPVTGKIAYCNGQYWLGQQIALTRSAGNYSNEAATISLVYGTPYTQYFVESATLWTNGGFLSNLRTWSIEAVIVDSNNAQQTFNGVSPVTLSSSATQAHVFTINQARVPTLPDVGLGFRLNKVANASNLITTYSNWMIREIL